MKEYRIVLESQLGPRTGTLCLEEDEAGTVTGSIRLLGFENAALGEWTGEHMLRLSHHLRTQVSDLNCVSVFKLEGSKISGTLQNDKNTMLWHGEKVTKEEGESQKNAGE